LLLRKMSAFSSRMAEPGKGWHLGQRRAVMQNPLR
jgi:hypothetical protein